MKPSMRPRALYLLLSVMVVLVLLASLPAAAQDAPPAAPSATAAASSNPAPAPYHPAAPAFATPKPASPASSSAEEGPQPGSHWEVEVHGGYMFAINPTSGTSNLPNPGLPFTTFGGDPTRAISSWYFGDGALLYNQWVANNLGFTVNTITPWDAVLNSSVVRRQDGGTVGGRVSYDFNRRVAAELNFDYNLGDLAYTSGALINTQATNDSWIAAWNEVFTNCAACAPFTVTSTPTVINHQGSAFEFTGGVNVNLWTSGRFIPFVSVGVGMLHTTGDTPSINLTGNYTFLFAPQVQTYSETDSATLTTQVAGNTFTGYVGVGFKYYVTPHWGFRVDVRDHISANGITNLLSASPSVALVPAGTGNCVDGTGTTPDLQFCNDPTVGNSSLSGPAISNFHSFSGSGALHQVGVTAGLFYRFGGTPAAPPTASCSVSPSEVFAGEPVQASASANGFNPKHTLNYAWTSTGGTVSGTEASANVDTKGLNPGSYTVSAHVTDTKNSKAMADCNAAFAVKERPKHAPEISCSANPATVQSGTPSNITCTCSTPDSGAEYQPPVTTSIGNWTSSAGKVSGSEGAATLDTAGVGAGPVTVSATCTDNRGLSSPGSATVSVEVPPAPPQASKLNDCEFKPGAKPARVDNECKAKLDDYALALQRDAEAKGVIVGSYDEKEGKNAKAARNLAAQRAANTKEYLVKEKGIDPNRLETRVDGASGRMEENWIVPAGATFSQEGTEVVTQKATAGAYGTGKKKKTP